MLVKTLENSLNYGDHRWLKTIPCVGEFQSICCLRNISEDAAVAIFPLRAKDFHVRLKATDMNI